MKNKIKEYKGVIGFYLIIILCIFLISTNNNYLNNHNPEGIKINTSINQK